MLAADYGFIAGELSIERHPHASEPDERIEPQGAQRKLVEQADEIVPPSGVCQFMKQDGVQLLFAEQPFDAAGKGNLRVEDAADRGSWKFSAEAHWYAVRYETGGQMIGARTGQSLILAMLFPDARYQSHKHAEGAGHPYQAEHYRRWALSHVPYRPANET